MMMMENTSVEDIGKRYNAAMQQYIVLFKEC